MATPEEVDRLFAPIAVAVETYATAHGLSLEKFKRGNLGWELNREHPEGGEQHMLLLYDDTLGLGIGSVWYFPCEEMDRIYYYWRQISACPLEAEKVIAALDAERNALARVRFGYWTHSQPLNPPESHTNS